MFAKWLHLFKPQNTAILPIKPPSPQPGISTYLSTYEQALEALNDREPETLLAVILVRDQLEAARQKDTTPAVKDAQQLVSLDGQLRQQVTAPLLLSLAIWRKSLSPPQAHWWWFLDEATAKKETDRDFLWQILAVTLFVLTVTLATDIIRRLWAYAPDNVAIVSTLLTMLITASPFTQNGRALITSLLRLVPRLPTHRHAEVMAFTALIAFLLIAGLRFLYLPQLAERYNDQGVTAVEEGQLTTARQKLQQAIAINNDLAPSYYNLAAAYETIARYDEAIHWYEQAFDHDLDFAPAYNNLGRLYLLQGEPAKAQTVLRSGLTVLQHTPVPELADERQTHLFIQYRLRTHLGQAYYEQELFDLAAEQLRLAVSMEQDGQLSRSLFIAHPHYYLALTLEALERPSAEIIAQLETALSYLAADDPAIWRDNIAERLSALR